MKHKLSAIALVATLFLAACGRPADHDTDSSPGDTRTEIGREEAAPLPE
jgi:predicted small lipoprotein YifL